MKEYLPRKAVFLLLLCFIFYFTAAAQTPGLIYKPAIGNGAKVLDPNADGYVSIAKTGFGSSADEGPGISEIPYRPFPALITEPIADLSTGSSGGHTDLATPNSSSAFTGSPVAAFFDGTNVLFRLRLGGSSTASKGYSVLIDSDQKFDGTGTNPGFEYEVLLASNFSVQVIRHTGTGSSTIFTGSADQYSQRSVAASASGGNPDYFYDFYVPLTAFGGGITATTPLRMSGITISSAQSGITSTVSDVGGVDFRAYNHDAPSAWRALIGVFPPTSLSTLQTSAFPQIAATAPVVASSILANSTSITGSSVEAPGSTITVYRSTGEGTPTLVGTTTVTANGTWTLTGISSNLLLQGNIITATVTASGKSVSAASAPVTVSEGVCIATPPPVITGMGGSGNQNRSFIGTTSYAGNQRISIYSAATNTTIGTFIFNSSTGGSTWTSPTYQVGEFNYYATTTPVDANGNRIGCESMRSNQICFRNGTPSINNQQVAITSVVYYGVTHTSASSSTWSEIPANVTSIGGTLGATPSGIVSGTTGYVAIYINGVEQTNTRTTISSTATSWAITMPTTSPPVLKAGDILSVRSVWTLSGGGQSTCPVPSSRSNFLYVQPTSDAPTINSPKCGLVTTLTGTSSEAAGTTLQFYTGGTAGLRDGTLITQSGTTTPITATVTSTGLWSVNLSGAAGGGIAAGTLITARAKAPGEVRSVNSNAVSATPGPTGALAITTPITEGDTKVAGTGPTSAAGSTVTLYIEDTPFPTNVVVASDGIWEVSGIASTELFAGARVTATFTPTNGCESIKSAVVTVSCKAPLTTFSMSAPPASICGGSTVNITLSGSEYGISYRLLVNGAESGASVLGTGGPITLVSGPITNYTSANTTASITYRARKVSGTACDATYASAATITVQPQPVIAGLLFTSTSQAVCANSSANFSLNGTNPNYNYQLVNQATNQLVGSAVQGSSTAAITLSTGTVTTNTSYSLRITSRTGDVNSCATVLSNQVSVTITSPSITRAVYPTASKVCVGGATNINVSTEPNNDFEYTVYRRAGTSPNPSSDSPLGTFRGNGQVQSVSTGSLGTAGTQTFYVTVRRMTNNVCGTLTLVNTAQVEVTNQPAIANAGSDRNVCGTTATLQGNAPTSGNGIWSQVGTTPTVARIVDPNNPNTTIENLRPGTYTFRWTVTVDCGGTTSSASDDVILTVNCEASYTLAIPKYKDTYSSGNVLATASDQDGTIISATILQGTLPAGVELSAENGLITVVRPNALVEGVYPLTISLVDQYRMTTVTTIVLRILGDSPVIVPLPVELVYLRASVQQRQVILQWLTASETDNKEFIVERSMDGKDFNAIGTVAGAGTTLQPQHYTFTDAAPLQQVVYYRLKQIDFNGDSEYSKVVAVRLNAEASEQRLKVWPNPFKGEASIEVFAEKAGPASITLTAMQGQRVYESTVQLDPGYNKLTLPPLDLPNGMYILRLQNEQLNESTKVVKE